MLMQIIRNLTPHWVKYKIDSLAARKFGSRNKICITRNKNDLIGLSLIGHRGNVNTDFHIGSFLVHVVNEIRVAKFVKCDLPPQ